MNDVDLKLMYETRVAIVWIRSRVLQLAAVVDSVIAVLLGFQVIEWTAEQTGLVMALVVGLLNLVAYADQVKLRDTVALHELDRDARQESE